MGSDAFLEKVAHFSCMFSVAVVKYCVRIFGMDRQRVNRWADENEHNE
jgi:hypothetical protein